MFTSVTIDWLTYTIPRTAKMFNGLSAERHAASFFRAATFGLAGWVQTKPQFGYDTAATPAGKGTLRASLSVSRFDMGVNVSWSGTALAGEDVQALLVNVLQAGGMVSRIDLALDIQGSTARPEDVWELAKRGEIVCKSRQRRIIQSEQGVTVYLGSRTSEKYLRVYDKAAQMEVGGHWVRVELECKSEFARAVSGYLVQNGLRDIPDLIRGYADCPTLGWWQDALGQRSTISVPKAEKRTDTRKWFLETVAPALVKYHRANPGFLEDWGDQIRSLIGGQGGVGEADQFDGAGDFDVQF